MPTPSAPRIDLNKLKFALSKKAKESGKQLNKHHPEAVGFLNKAGLEPGKIREHAAKIAATGALASALFLGPPLSTHAVSAPNIKIPATSRILQNQTVLELNKILPEKVGPLTPEQEKIISEIINNIWGIKAFASLENEKLNRSYGLIGAEQHLPRFPGDSVAEHDEYQNSGITPGRGAWGYFAYSRANLTKDIIMKEKYYVAVQTLYLPDWNTRTKYLREWYKYRKVLVVNPVNGKTIVADIADAGPAKFTDKHFGGSPEVMAYLGLNVHMQKGPVILFFVDDPNNEVPLGPVDYNVISGPARLAEQIP